MTRHGVFSELYFSEITLAKRPSKLVFPQSHSLPHLLLFRLLSHHPITGLEFFQRSKKKTENQNDFIECSLESVPIRLRLWLLAVCMYVRGRYVYIWKRGRRLGRREERLLKLKRGRHFSLLPPFLFIFPLYLFLIILMFIFVSC